MVLKDHFRLLVAYGCSLQAFESSLQALGAHFRLWELISGFGSSIQALGAIAGQLFIGCKLTEALESSIHGFLGL